MFKLHSLCMLGTLVAIGACKQTNDRALDLSHPPPGSSEAGTPLTESSSAPSTNQAAPLVSQHRIANGSSFYQSLKSEGINSQTILALVKSAEKIFPVKEIEAGTAYSITWNPEESVSPRKVELKYAADSSLVIEKSETDLEWTASKTTLPVTLIRKTFRGVVGTTLWESAEIVGMDPVLITSLAEVFAWQVDFNRAVKRGDRWRLTVEQKLVADQPIGWGNILVAEYENDGQLHTGIRFPQEGAHGSYYMPNGQSLKRMFLKSPIKFGRITSGFSQNRFHPILKTNRPHNGVDYGAPTGTPVMAVGKGEVISIGYTPANGNMIKLRHGGGYQTAYVHLHNFASGLHLGSNVEQGQIIGAVGSTGMATGPHLHFAFYTNGVYADPMGLKFPSAEPIGTSDLNQFKQLASNVLQTLPAWQMAQQEPVKASTLDGENPSRPLMH